MSSGGFVRNTDGTYATFDVLDARETYPAGINDSGQVAGYYYANEGGYHGFVAVPPVREPWPTIRSVRGVMSASAFGGFDAVAPGSWIEIYGQNLASSSRQWRASDFSGTTAPTSLDGVSVQVNGRPAYVSYISPGQVNAQVLFSLTSAFAQVTVTNAGITSAPVGIPVSTGRAGLLEIRPVNSSTRFAAALFPDNQTYVLPPSTGLSVPARRAKAGDTITLYGIGFGPVTPGWPAGNIATQLTSLQARFEILFNAVPGTVAYAGLMPGAVGLYQFNIVVPDGILRPEQPADNQVMLTFQLNGVPGTQKLYTAVE